MKLNWDEEYLVVRKHTDNMGPWTFDMDAGMPDGLTIVDCDVVAKQDMVVTTAQLIYSKSYTVSTVSVNLKHPGAALRGKHSLRFNLTFNSGAKDTFVFGYIIVE